MEVLRRLAETCGDLQRLSFSHCKMANKYCGDVRRRRIRTKAAQKTPKSWLVIFPRPVQAAAPLRRLALDDVRPGALGTSPAARPTGYCRSAGVSPALLADRPVRLTGLRPAGRPVSPMRAAGRAPAIARTLPILLLWSLLLRGHIIGQIN